MAVPTVLLVDDELIIRESLGRFLEAAGYDVIVLTGIGLDPTEEDIVRRHRAYVFYKPGGYKTLLQQIDKLTRKSVPS